MSWIDSAVNSAYFGRSNLLNIVGLAPESNYGHRKTMKRNIKNDSAPNSEAPVALEAYASHLAQLFNNISNRSTVNVQL